MKKRHRGPQQASSASQRQGRKDKGVGNSAEKGIVPMGNAAATLKSKYYKGTITRDEIPELLTRLEVWNRDDILLALAIMRGSPSDAEVQRRCLQVLAGDGGGDVMNHGTTEILIGASGGTELVLSALRTFRDSREIQECGCYALTRLIIVRENLRKFVRCNGFEVLIWHVLHNTTTTNNNNNSNNNSTNTSNTNNTNNSAVSLTHIRTLKYALALLLSNRSTEKLVQPFISAGGVEAVIAALRCSLASEALVHACLSLLSTLGTRKPDAVAARVSRVPLGLEAVTAAMALYPHSRGIQASAGALVHAALARSPRLGDRFCAAEGAPAALAGLVHHRDRPATVGALLGLVELAAALSPAFQDAVAALKGVDLVVALLGKYEGNNQVQVACFRALTALARASRGAQMAVERAGGIAAALIALKKWEKSQRKTAAVCEALFAFTWANPQAQEALCTVQGVDVLACMLGVHCKTSRAAAEGIAKVLVSVLSTLKLHSAYCAEGVVQMVESALATYPDSVVLGMCVDCLRRVAADRGLGACSGMAACKEMGLEHKADLSYNWCQNCCSPQILYRCITCDDDGGGGGDYNINGGSEDKKRSTKLYCKYCWEKCHKGHTGVEMFIVGSCSTRPTQILSSSSSSSSLNIQQEKTKSINKLTDNP